MNWTNLAFVTHHKDPWTSSKLGLQQDCRYKKKIRRFAPNLWTLWSKNSFSHASPQAVNISASELCASRITRCEQSVETVQYLRSITKVLEMSQVLLEMDMNMTCELRAVARLTHLLSPLPHKSHHELYLHECYSFFFHYYIYVSLASSKGRPFDV